MLIDSHCHITDDEVALRAYNSGVAGMLNAGSDVDESEQQILMCERFKCMRDEKKEAPLMWTSAGVHPDSAPQKLSSISVDDLVKASQNPFVVAIGECGLDYHYGAEYKNEQKEMFIRHIEASGISGLPIMIHQREAEDDMLKILRTGKEKYPELRGVIHCFTSNQNFADAVYGLGFYISASGVITFKSASDIAEVFRGYDMHKILVETDSPYLAPVPYRGKENEPAYVVKTLEKLAEIRGLSVDETARLTTNNFFNLYKKAKG